MERRDFIKSLAALPPALALPHALAAVHSSRTALVIGNSRYSHAPLSNPANDARDFGQLLATAGFSVDNLLDQTRQGMVAAIERFGKAVARSDTKLAVFYYAGHGVQLDWRNYLLPVDAEVDTAEHLRQRCVDLGLLLGMLGSYKDKTFVIILDACRDDPFAGTYRPAQKGLSQFDAPVGSLLAYATSPGNVASDGTGRNGLYTENLLRELAQRGTRIEDALKRVRLNVRLGSRGAQIPWETTSLESDVFIFADGARKLSDSELDKLLESEIAEWSRIKNSRKADDWIAYLRNYPNGRFAEIAQARLSRLLAEVERGASAISAAAPVPAVKPADAPTAPAVVQQAPLAVARTEAPTLFPATTTLALDFSAEKPASPVVIVSENPNSAGRFPHGRLFTVGDVAEFVIRDTMTGNVTSHLRQVITKVDPEADRVEANDGAYVFDLMGNGLRSPDRGSNDMPAQVIPAEIYVGKKWTAGWIQQHPRFGELLIDLELRVAAMEKLLLSIGEFSAFRIDGDGWVRNHSVRLTRKIWVVPGINFALRVIALNNRMGRPTLTDQIDLVSLRQQSMDSTLASATAGSRGLVLRSR